MTTMTLNGRFQYAGYTNKGMVRRHNEDHISFDEELGLAIVADGMGGYKAGEVASALAVVTITDWVRSNLEKARSGNDETESGLTLESVLLRDAIHRANHAIYRASTTQERYAGMGTTIVACLFRDERVAIAHVGDSRLYRLRHGHFEQVTTDHSLLAELVARGFYTPEEARKSMNKNLVTRAVGIEKKVEVDVVEEPVVTGDVFLLCSDGLTDMVEDDNIGLTISGFGANLQAAAEQLVQLANDNGGRDNISALLVRADQPPAAGRRWFGRLTDWFG